MLADPQELRAEQLSKRLPPLHDLEGLWGYLNSKGEVRLESVRNPTDAPRLDLDRVEDQVTLIRLYREWVTDDNNVILESEDEETRDRALHTIKASKRGNDVAVTNIGERLRDVEANIAPFAGYPMTGVLFVTLTYDHARVPGGIEDAWRRVGKDYNRFMAAVRKWIRAAAPGANVYAHRSWEAQKSGWPHPHLILVFTKASWLVWEQKRNEEQTTYRVEDATNRKLRELWGLGHVDVQAVPSGKVPQRLRDILWYVTKDTTEADYRTIETWTWKKLLGLAIGWYLGMRLWSASRLLTLPPYTGRGEPRHEYRVEPTPETAELWRCVRCATVVRPGPGGRPPEACTADEGGCGRPARDTRFMPFGTFGEGIRDLTEEHIDAEGWHPESCLTCRKAWVAGQPRRGDLTRAVGLTQTNLAGEEVVEVPQLRVKWTFVGMVRGGEVGIPPEEWHQITPLPPRRRVRRLKPDEQPLPCASCGARSVGIVHHEDADEDVAVCKDHAAQARDAYPDWVAQAWVPKRMRKRSGGNMAEAFA